MDDVTNATEHSRFYDSIALTNLIPDQSHQCSANASCAQTSCASLLHEMI